MKDSIFTDEQVAAVKQRHQARKGKPSWDHQDRQSVTENMDNLLAELDRTNGMVEYLREECRKRADQIAALSGSSPLPPAHGRDMVKLPYLARCKEP